MRPLCHWREDDEGHYDTSCGSRFSLNEGTPKDNHMRFCCYCGKTLHQELVKRAR